MSKHKNYNKMYNSGNSEARVTEPVAENEPAIIEDVAVEEPVVIEEPAVVEPVIEESIVEEPVVEEPAPKYVVGVVANCNSLNVREQPDRKADVIAVLRSGTEIQVDIENTLDVWFHVYTATGLDGFCMKEYIDVKE